MSTKAVFPDWHPELSVAEINILTIIYRIKNPALKSSCDDLIKIIVRLCIGGMKVNNTINYGIYSRHEERLEKNG